MPRRNISDESRLVEIIQHLPFEEQDKTQWVESIHSAGLSEELAKEIRTKATALPRGEADQAFSHAREVIELGNIIQRWRLKQNIPGLKRRNTGGSRHNR